LFSDGALKMQNLYRTNPKMGDLSVVEEQLKLLNSEIEELHEELNKYIVI
jgi:hypothetical protein